MWSGPAPGEEAGALVEVRARGRAELRADHADTGNACRLGMAAPAQRCVHVADFSEPRCPPPPTPVRGLLSVVLNARNTVEAQIMCTRAMGKPPGPSQ